MKTTDGFDIWRRLTLLSSILEDAVGTHLRRAHSMTTSEFLALLNLAEAEDGALRIQSLADQLGLDQSSVSRLIGRLAKRNWLERCVCPDDGRGIYAEITDEGREQIEISLPGVRETVEEAFNTAALEDPTAVLVARLHNRAFNTV